MKKKNQRKNKVINDSELNSIAGGQMDITDDELKDMKEQFRKKKAAQAFIKSNTPLIANHGDGKSNPFEPEI